MGFVSGLDIASGKVGDQFPGWHAERTHHRGGRTRTGWFGTFSAAGWSFQNGGGLVRESPKTPPRSGLGSIVICPE